MSQKGLSQGRYSGRGKRIRFLPHTQALPTRGSGILLRNSACVLAGNVEAGPASATPATAHRSYLPLPAEQRAGQDLTLFLIPRVLSDLHQEFGSVDLPNDADDAVVLAGDIDRGVKGVVWARQAFPGIPVLYVAGNHEHYDEVSG